MTIAAGSTSATINVATIDDALVEDRRCHVHVGVDRRDPHVTIDGANDVANITILTTTRPPSRSPAPPTVTKLARVAGVFTVTQTAAESSDTVLTYSVAGSADSVDDFTALTGTVTIAAGSTTATINVATIDDATRRSHRKTSRSR